MRNRVDAARLLHIGPFSASLRFLEARDLLYRSDNVLPSYREEAERRVAFEEDQQRRNQKLAQIAEERKETDREEQELKDKHEAERGRQANADNEANQRFEERFRKIREKEIDESLARNARQDGTLATAGHAARGASSANVPAGAPPRQKIAAAVISTLGGIMDGMISNERQDLAREMKRLRGEKEGSLPPDKTLSEDD